MSNNDSMLVAQLIARINDRLDRPIHWYSDKSLPETTERNHIRDLYGDEIIDDLEAILASFDLPTEPGHYFDAGNHLSTLRDGKWFGEYGDPINPDLLRRPLKRLVATDD